MPLCAPNAMSGAEWARHACFVCYSAGRCVFDLSVCGRPGGSEAAGGREKIQTENRGPEGGPGLQGPAAFLSHSVVAVPAVHDSSDSTNDFAFVGRDPGKQGTEENGCVRSRAEEQLAPRIDVRRLYGTHLVSLVKHRDS